MNQETLRWQYRFDHFKRAYFLLQEACEQYGEGKMEQLAKEGMIQRFKVCVELAWKTIKDYMEYNHHVFAQIYPSIVIKEAFAAKLLADGEGWLEALDTRNKMSHTYDFAKFEVALGEISTLYIQLFGDLYETLADER